MKHRARKKDTEITRDTGKERQKQTHKETDRETEMERERQIYTNPKHRECDRDGETGTERERETPTGTDTERERETPTPADESVPPEILLLGDEGEGQQGLEVHAFHQEPEVVSQDAKLEEGHRRLAGSLREESIDIWPL